MRTKKIALIVVILLYTELAFADCIYNGVSYPSGTVLGPYVCSGTQWVIRQ